MLFEIVDEPTDLLVNAVNHGSERNHAVCFVRSLPRNDIFPRPDMRRAWAGRERIRKKPQPNLFFDAGVTYLIPAFGVPTLVLGIIFRKRMKRSMRRIKSDI